ncbi:MAG: ribonuclease HI [Cellvibrionaceae bacterium]
MSTIEIYCDGSCRGNPGPSGVGLAIYVDDELIELWYGDYEDDDTNNRAELRALTHALSIARCCVGASRYITIYSDSTYAIDCVTKYAYQWKRQDWDVDRKNLDLVKEAFEVFYGIRRNIQIEHVFGHTCVEGNELADKLAKKAVTGFMRKLQLYSGCISELL